MQLVQKLNEYIDGVERIDLARNFIRQAGPLRQQLDGMLDQALSIAGSTTEQDALLSKLAADLESVNFHILTLFRSSALPVVEHYYSFSFITSQNATILQPGEQLEVITGLGKFHYEPSLRITVNGKSTTINEKGMVSWSTKVSNQPGNYEIPTRIEWFDQDGVRKYYEDKIRYRVQNQP